MKTKNIFLKIDLGIQSFICALIPISLISCGGFKDCGIPLFFLLIIIGIWQFSTSILYAIFRQIGSRKYYFPVAILTLIGFYLGMRDNWYNFLIHYDFLMIIPVGIAIWYYKITFDEYFNLKSLPNSSEN